MICLSCIDSQHEQTFPFFLGEIFNREGDIILSDIDLINFSHQSCNGCKNFIFHIIHPISDEEFTMGCVLLKEKVKTNNMLPKNHEIASTSAEITLRKDEDFDILCFEINMDFMEINILMDFCQLAFVSGLSTFHVFHHRLLFPILITTVVMVMSLNLFSCKK